MKFFGLCLLLIFFNIKKEISWDYNLDGKVCAVNEHMIEVVTCQTDRSVAIVSISCRICKLLDNSFLGTQLQGTRESKSE